MRENNYRHIGSIASQAGVTRHKAIRALDMDAKATARDTTVKEMCDAVGLSEATVKRYSRQFGIRLADYNPFANQHRKTRGKRLVYSRLRPEA